MPSDVQKRYEGIGAYVSGSILLSLTSTEANMSSGSPIRCRAGMFLSSLLHINRAALMMG